MNLVKIFSMLWILIGLVETFAPIANAGQDPVLENELARAAMEFKVPYLLLHSIARVESGGEHRLPKDEDPRNDRKSPPSYGVMGLRNDAWFGKSLLKSAQLLGRNSDDLIMDRKTNIRAAAAYLRSLAMEEDARGGSISMDAQTALTKNLLPWSKVIERYSGIPGADAKIYASEILAAMAPWNPPMVEAASQQSPPIIWDPTPNHSGRLHPRFIVIHTTEGPYATAISWFKNPESAASAHYVIRGDGAITQMVDDDTVAWHARCWNDYAIGIEHEAYSTNGSGMTNALYNSSARLVKMLAEKYNIPLDKDHIIGHDFWETKEFLSTPVLGDCQDHNDPGPYWDWRRYFNSLMENI